MIEIKKLEPTLLIMNNRMSFTLSSEFKGYLYTLKLKLDKLEIVSSLKEHLFILEESVPANHIFLGKGISAIRNIFEVIDLSYTSEALNKDGNLYLFENNISKRISHNNEKIQLIDDIEARTKDIINGNIIKDKNHYYKPRIELLNKPLLLRFENIKKDIGYLNIYSSQHTKEYQHIMISTNDNNINIVDLYEDLKELKL